MMIGIVAIAFLLTAIPWGKRSNARALDSDGELIPPPILDRLVDQSRIREARNDPTIASHNLPGDETGNIASTSTSTSTKEDNR